MTWPTTSELREELDAIRRTEAKQLDALCNFERKFQLLLDHNDEEKEMLQDFRERLERLEGYVRPRAA